MRKVFFTFLILFSLTSQTIVEIYAQTASIEKTAGNIYNGFTSATEWYDIPIGLAYFSRKLIKPNNIGDIISIPPANFDEEFSEEIGGNGRSSFGSIDQDIYPNAVFFGRLIASSYLNLFTDAKVTEKTFRNIFLFKKSLVYTYTITEYVKSFIKRHRPDNSDTRSFFSGHTSTTFAASTYLYLELNDLYNNWEITRRNNSLRTVFKASTFGILYGWAGYVGYCRLRDNKHYISDVLLGASVGTLVSLFVYNLYHDDEESGILTNFNLHPGPKESITLSFNLNF